MAAPIFVVASLTVASMADPASADGPTLPPVGTIPDYQLGGAYPPGSGIGIIARDRSSQPVSGIYSSCYVNGFQTQPGELKRWPKSLLLRRGGKRPFDRGWPDEVVLNTSTALKRKRIARIMTPWTGACAAKGFNAIEFDNLDSFTRSRGLLNFRNNLLLARDLVSISHRAGLAVGQKNTVERSQKLRDRDLSIPGQASYVFQSCAGFR